MGEMGVSMGVNILHIYIYILFAQQEHVVHARSASKRILTILTVRGVITCCSRVTVASHHIKRKR